jgi:hypothetical protein
LKTSTFSGPISTTGGADISVTTSGINTSISSTMTTGAGTVTFDAGTSRKYARALAPPRRQRRESATHQHGAGDMTFGDWPGNLNSDGSTKRRTAPNGAVLLLVLRLKPQTFVVTGGPGRSLKI